MDSQVDHYHQQPDSPLLSLPAELRLRIYDYIYYEKELRRACIFTLLNSNDISIFRTPSSGHSGTASHLRTCKQIYDEAPDLFYSNMPFILCIFGCDQPLLQDMAPYGSIEDCPTLQKVRNLEIVLHLFSHDEVTSMLQRLHRALNLLDSDQQLRTCDIEFEMYGKLPQRSAANAALSIVQNILEIERDGGLTTVESQVYSRLWSETMRLARRTPDHYGAYKSFGMFLEENNAGLERDVGKTGGVSG